MQLYVDNGVLKLNLLHQVEEEMVMVLNPFWKINLDIGLMLQIGLLTQNLFLDKKLQYLAHGKCIWMKM
jgi:hypothetical protein